MSVRDYELTCCVIRGMQASDHLLTHRAIHGTGLQDDGVLQESGVEALEQPPGTDVADPVPVRKVKLKGSKSGKKLKKRAEEAPAEPQQDTQPVLSAENLPGRPQ